MLYAKSSPEADKQLLQELKQTSDAKWYRQVKLIQLSSQHTPVSQLSKLFDCCGETLRRYIKRYHADGLDGLRPQTSNGSPAKIPLTKAEWKELLHLKSLVKFSNWDERTETGCEEKPSHSADGFSSLHEHTSGGKL